MLPGILDEYELASNVGKGKDAEKLSKVALKNKKKRENKAKAKVCSESWWVVIW